MFTPALKTKENFILLALKVVAVAQTGPEVVAYKRFQIFWIDLESFGILIWNAGRLREVVATGGST